MITYATINTQPDVLSQINSIIASKEDQSKKNQALCKLRVYLKDTWNEAYFAASDDYYKYSKDTRYKYETLPSSLDVIGILSWVHQNKYPLILQVDGKALYVTKIDCDTEDPEYISKKASRLYTSNILPEMLTGSAEHTLEPL